MTEPVNPTGRVANILAEVWDEIESQYRQWGDQDHTPDYWNAILGEEAGEVAKAVVERDGKGYRRELVQVAAVAVNAAYDWDRAPRFLDLHDTVTKVLESILTTVFYTMAEAETAGLSLAAANRELEEALEREHSLERGAALGLVAAEVLRRMKTGKPVVATEEVHP